MDIEQLNSYEEMLHDLSLKNHETAREHLIARQKQASLRYDIEYSVAKVLSQYQEERKSIGYEMAIMKRMEQAIQEEDTVWLDTYKDYLYQTARYKGLEAALSAMQNELIAIQSIMKWKQNSETFSS